MQAPSRKIIILIASAIIVVGAIGVNKFWPSASEVALVSPQYNAGAAPEGAAPLSSINAIDGTAFLQSFATSSAPTTTDPTPSSPSRDIARTIFANAAYLENSGSLGEAEKQALVSNAIAEIQNAFAYKEYGVENLQLVADDAASLRSYAESFAEEQIAMILEMQARVGEIQANLGALGDIYEKQARNLYSLATPKSLASAHLEVIRNFSKAAAAFRAFGNEKNDPIVLPVAISVYQEATTNQEALLGAMARHFRDNGIIFTSNEPGGYWNAFL